MRSDQSQDQGTKLDYMLEENLHFLDWQRHQGSIAGGADYRFGIDRSQHNFG